MNMITKQIVLTLALACAAIILAVTLWPRHINSTGEEPSTDKLNDLAKQTSSNLKSKSNDKELQPNARGEPAHPGVERVAGVPAPTDQELITKAYNADSLDELNQTLWLLGDYHPDTFALKSYANWLCKGYNNSAWIAKFQQSDSTPDVPSKGISLEYISSYANRFCGDYVKDFANGEIIPYYEWLEVAYKRNEDPTINRYLEIARSELQRRSFSEKESQQIQSDLEHILYSTDSPYVFHQAGVTLAEDTFGEWKVGPSALSTAETVSQRKIQLYGVLLAQCQMSQACGPNSLMALRLCARYFCEPGITAYEAIRKKISPFELELAQQVSNEIIQRRREAQVESGG